MTQLYVDESHPLSQVIAEKAKNNATLTPAQILDSKLQMDPSTSKGVSGYLLITGEACPKTLPSPFGLGEDISTNGVCFASYLHPSHQPHHCKLMDGANDEAIGLMKNDIPPEAQPWHEHPGHNHEPPQYWQRAQFAIDKRAATRIIEHGIAAPRFKSDAPSRTGPTSSKLSPLAPEFVPDYVTQRALQMTGEKTGPQNYPIPPREPPRHVTDAAIKLSERVHRGPRAPRGTPRRQEFQWRQPPFNQQSNSGPGQRFSFDAQDPFAGNRRGGGNDGNRGQYRRDDRNSGSRKPSSYQRPSKR